MRYDLFLWSVTQSAPAMRMSDATANIAKGSAENHCKLDERERAMDVSAGIVVRTILSSSFAKNRSFKLWTTSGRAGMSAASEL